MTDLFGHRLGDFEIVRERGDRGMSVVIEARQGSLNCQVSLVRNAKRIVTVLGV